VERERSGATGSRGAIDFTTRHVSIVASDGIGILTYPRRVPDLLLQPRCRSTPSRTIADATGERVLDVRQEAWFFRPRYRFYRSGSDLACLQATSVIRHRHHMRLADGSTWDFRTPFLFSGVSGIASNGDWVRGFGVRHWYLTIRAREHRQEVLAAVVVLHDQWYNTLS
jgi:hypothetical protein